jgi:hypothetical protein
MHLRDGSADFRKLTTTGSRKLGAHQARGNAFS